MKLDFKLLYRIAFFISLIGLIATISDFGFSHDNNSKNLLDAFYFIVLGVGVVATVARYLKNRDFLKRKTFIFDVLSVGFSLTITVFYVFLGVAFEADVMLENPIWLKLAVVLTFIRESSEVRLNYKRTVLNPAQLFILSFMFIIFIGSILLMLPNATSNGISYIDALFTATSAVCVTGLAVVDTGVDFTIFGQTIIMILIQVGGLGILTFASYFSYFFKGGTSYENQLALSEMNISRNLGDIFSTLKYIILITFGIELFSGILIYTSLDPSNFDSHSEQIFFSIFHAISSFNNAGFSTLTNNLYETGFKYNYYLHLIIISTFVLGGLGFPIVVNLLKYLKYKIITLFSPSRSKYRPWILNLNSRITLVTTLSITVVAFILFYFLEYNNTLADHTGFGKMVTALFGATTPRTSGFNTIDSSQMALPTLILVMVLMWIGASPQSTGGGIKTSTFAVAVLNILSLARGKARIEIFRREISEVSVRRAFAIITLSLVVILVGIALIAHFEPSVSLEKISFEVISAFGTAGLSLGITAGLTTASKIVLISVMFIGRISMLSVVIAVFKKVKHKNYSYPKEEITIN
jgi:trk system potassium uptake protein TrkH